MNPGDEVEIMESLRALREALAVILEMVAEEKWAWKVNSNREMVAKLKKYRLSDFHP